MSEQKRDRLKDEKILSDYSASGNLALMQAAIIGAHWINRAEKAEDEILAVMHSVDKWLEEKALNENPATRAVLAREVALREIENLQAMLEAKGE